MANDDRHYVIKPNKTGAGYDPLLFENNVQKTGDLEFDKVGDGIKKTGFYKLYFTIDNSRVDDADKLIFASGNDRVMAVHTDLRSCPPDGSQMQDAFWVDKNERRKLRLINMDLKEQKFRFKINMVREADPTGALIPLDPIVNNGNRGGAEPFVEFSYGPVVAGAIAGLAAVLAINAGLMPANAIVFGIGGALVGLVVSLAFGRR